MFEIVILVTFVMWCVFGFILLKNRIMNVRRFVIGKIKG